MPWAPRTSGLAANPRSPFDSRRYRWRDHRDRDLPTPLRPARLDRWNLRAFARIRYHSRSNRLSCRRARGFHLWHAKHAAVGGRLWRQTARVTAVVNFVVEVFAAAVGGTAI